MCIICPIHGEFWQLPNVHLMGHGCPKCSASKLSIEKRSNKEEFIKKSIETNGDNNYVYDEVEYVNCYTPVCIICKKHGKFWQRPTDHIHGQGCPKCASIVNGLKHMIPFEKFVEKANEAHNNKYKYIENSYNGMSNYTDIICAKHGLFTQNAKAHVSGQGCPKCNQSKLENEIEILLNQYNIEYLTQFSYDDSNKRFKLDFYLPKYNIGIECQGKQHFMPTFSWNKNNDEQYADFNKIVERDTFKRNKCKELGIKLLYYTNSSLINEMSDINSSIYDGFIYSSKEELINTILSTKLYN